MSLVGSVCLKLAGRDANRFCVIVEELDTKMVLVDGDTRRKKCSLRHLKVFPKKVSVTSKSSTEDVRKALSGAGVALSERKFASKDKKSKKEKPVSKRVLKAAENVKRKAEAPKKIVKKKKNDGK